MIENSGGTQADDAPRLGELDRQAPEKQAHENDPDERAESAPGVSAVDEGAPDERTRPEHAKSQAGSRFRRRRRLRRGYQALSILTVLFFLPVSFVRLSGDPYVHSISTVPAEPVGIVFGAEVIGDTPSAYLASRLDVSIALWKAHKIKVFLVSGEKSSPDYNEPQAMRDYLVAHGVPGDLIVLDDAGFDTWQTCDRAKRVFGVDRAIVVSQSFHVPRAVYLCRAAGIEAYGVGDGDAGWALGHEEYLRDESREVLAGMNATYQALFRPNPVFPGARSTDIADALRAAG